MNGGSEFDVSVVIPTYNGERFLQATVASVLEQSFLPKQIIISDDCSTDGTRKCASAISRNSAVPIVILTAESNSGGPVVPMNRGIAAAGTRWIAMLDQDDFFVRSRIDECAGAVSRYPKARMILGDYVSFSDQGEIPGSDAKGMASGDWLPERDHGATHLPAEKYLEHFFRCHAIQKSCSNHFF